MTGRCHISAVEFMTPHDQARVRTSIAEFVSDCAVDPPFHVVMIGSNGSVTVARYAADRDVEPLCDHIVDGGLATPITVTLITPDGGRGAKITVEAAHTLQ